MLNVEPRNIVLLKTYNTEFDDIIITFSDQNGRLFEIADTMSLTLLIINRNETLLFRTNNNKVRQKDMDFCQSRQIYPANLRKKLIENATKTGLDAAKSAS